MEDFERELKECFLDESTQLLESSEQYFLNLETNPQDIAILEHLFRLAHNLKGGARGVGFIPMGEFTHELESLLLKLKKRELAVTPEMVSLLLECNDHLRRMVETLQANME